MKEIYLKIALIFSFLIFTLPGSHVILPNGAILIILIFQTIEYYPEAGYNLNLNIEAFLALITSISCIFIILKNKYINLFGLILQYIWLCYLIKKSDLKHVFCVSTLLFYILLSLLFIVMVLLKNKKIVSNNTPS